jgi:ABC-type amino acid transport system permease subunit
MEILGLIWKYKEAFLHGLENTVYICLLVWFIGLAVGIYLGYFANKYKVMGLSLGWTANIITALPVIVFLFWLHYPLQSILQIVINPFITSVIAFSVVNILGVANIVRTAIAEFPDQYLLAARTLGISHKQVIRKIQFPLILRCIIPPLLNLQINMLQMSLFASFIGVEEIFRMAQRVNSIAYKPIEIYTALGLFFILICLPVNLFTKYLQGKYTRNISEK